MALEPLTENASQQEAGAAGEGLGFEIVDNTSAEQVAKEHELLSTDQAETNGQARNQQQSQIPAEPQSTVAQPGDESESSTKSARNYTQGEVSKMQAAWARQIEEARRNASQATDQLQRFNIDAAVEAMLQSQVEELTPNVGADRARQLVRSPQNTSLARQSIANQQMLSKSETHRKQVVAQQERQAKFIVAREFAREHNVAPEDFEVLAAAPTPQAMKALARRLSGTDAAALRDRVPPETSQTQLENGYHAGPAPESADRRLERIRARPAWEWTEADLRYMKTGEMR